MHPISYRAHACTTYPSISGKTKPPEDQRTGFRAVSISEHLHRISWMLRVPCDDGAAAATDLFACFSGARIIGTPRPGQVAATIDLLRRPAELGLRNWLAGERLRAPLASPSTLPGSGSIGRGDIEILKGPLHPGPFSLRSYYTVQPDFCLKPIQQTHPCILVGGKADGDPFG